MAEDQLAQSLHAEISKIPIIDVHSHIDPLSPTARSLDDLLSYHYYTELAHSAGMGHEPLRADADPRERCRAILEYAEKFDNTVQWSWLVQFFKLCKILIEPGAENLTDDFFLDRFENIRSHPDWEKNLWRFSKLERVFLTNAFDDPLEGFDTARYVPCLRTDDLVFHLDKPEVRVRLAKSTNIDVGDELSVRAALRKLFERFVNRGAKACAISLPPDFEPRPDTTFWQLAELCREFHLPFDLMIGVNRNVYPAGVHQGRDLFDRRTSLIQYAGLFNAFPEVTFCVSVLTSAQNQELASYAWIFPNVIASGHWWYSNVPSLIEADLRLRLDAVPKVKLIGYYSDAYKLEFVLPKFHMYRCCLARVLAELVRSGRQSETQAVALARTILYENLQQIFDV